MTPKQATERGYVPTSITARDPRVAKAKAEKYRKTMEKSSCVVRDKDTKGKTLFVIYSKEPVKRGPQPMKPPKERKCRRCKEIKPIKEFYSSKTSSGGHSYVCKECNTLVVHESSLKRRLKKLGREEFIAEIERLKHEISVRRRVLKHNEAA